MNENMKIILDKIKEYKKIIIFRHFRPDGDAVGSTKGFAELLKNTYPEKEIYTVGDPSKRYGFIEDSATDTIPDEYYKGALAFVLDTSAKSLIADDRYTLADTVIKMDHHIFCEEFAYHKK